MLCWKGIHSQAEDTGLRPDDPGFENDGGIRGMAELGQQYGHIRHPHPCINQIVIPDLSGRGNDHLLFDGIAVGEHPLNPDVG